MMTASNLTVKTHASAYRGPCREHLQYDGTLTDEHYVAVTANNPRHRTEIVRIFPDVEAAVVFACGIADLRRKVEVHVLARGWGFPSLCSRIWPAK